MITDRILMVKPACFGSNPETLVDNAFQQVTDSSLPQDIQAAALKESQGLVTELKKAGIHVDVVEDATTSPDAIFPNNWISFHSHGGGKGRVNPVINLYPMKSPIRRMERRKDIVSTWSKMLGSEIKDYSSHEDNGEFLEGTGSIVLDRPNNIVYACLSQRTDANLLREFCNDFDFRLVSFRANSVMFDGSLIPIYHTNVILCIGTTFAVVCLESITDPAKRDNLHDSLTKSGKEVITISLKQVASFCGNILQLKTCHNTMVLVMSTQAFKAFNKEQLETFSKHSCSVVHSNIETIEKCGGGGARCMIAEIFPPLK